MTGYIYLSLRCLSGKGTIVPPLLIIAISVTLHLQVIFFIPSLIPLFFSRGFGERLWSRYKRILLSVGATLLLAGFAVFVYYYQTVLDFRIHFLPPFSGRPARPDYALFSTKHLWDIFNYVSLLIPAWMILLLGWGRAPYRGQMRRFFNPDHLRAVIHICH
jgi:hypothetical protein